MHRPSDSSRRAMTLAVTAILVVASGWAAHAPGRASAATQGTIARVTPVEVAARDRGARWVTTDRLAYVHTTTVVEPDRWVIRANLYTIDEDGSDGWTGPAVATEYEAMYDYAPATDTYVYFRNRFLTSTPDQFSVGVFGPDQVEHVILGPDPNTGPLPFGETFSPDGQDILFYRSVPSSAGGLHVATIDGTDVIRLLGAGGGGYGSFSPDGTRIAIGGSNEVGVIDIDGTDGHIIATDSRFNGEVAWSPDGSTIALAGGTGLFLLDPAGIEAPLLVTSEAVSSPNWSPDGSRLAVTHSYTTTPEPRDEIAIVNADGTGFHDVTEVGASWSAVRPAWSPDGTRIAFESDMESTVPANQGGPDVSTSIYVLTLGPDVVGLTIDTTSTAFAGVPRLGRFEKTFKLSRFYGLDVHDPDIIDVTATFAAPSGAELTVPAWFGTDLTLRAGTGIGGSELYDPVPISPPAPGIWHVRFSPDEIGTYTYTIRAEDKRPLSSSTVVSEPLTFDVTASAAHGQVERDPRDGRFLRYEDGAPYLPMGHNVAFGDGNPFNDGSHYFEPHFASMAAAGQNWTRVWMTDFYITALEWSSGHWSGQYTGVGQYPDVPAYRIDQVLQLAEQYGLDVQLVLNDHGQFSSWVNARWSENPYSSAQGGPVPAADPAAFFTNPAAKELFKQRLRYLVARYSAYRDLLAWELFNEVQFVGSAASNPYSSAQVRDDIVAWHAEMAAYLRSIDPYDHLITTSSDIESSMAAIWDDPNIDLVQVHDYGALSGRDQRFSGYAASLNGAYHKPVIIGEYGLSGEPELDFDPTTSALSADRVAHLVQATHLHNSTWSAAISASGAMSWWWGNYIHSSAARHRTAPDFPANERINPPLRDFFVGEDPAGMGLAASSIGAPASVVALGLDNGSRGFVWVRDALNEYGSGVGPGDVASRTVSGVSLTLAGFLDGTYRVEVHDPWGVAPVDASLVATAVGGTLTLPLPSFQRDIALKIRPGGPAPSAVLPPGGILTSDDEGDGPDVSNPVSTTITTPVGGLVSIASSPSADPPTAGYSLVGMAVDIIAPSATAADPLVLVFRIDSSAIPDGDSAASVQLFRNGVVVVDCTGASGVADPDPCIAARQTLADGDIQLTIRTSGASTWSAGVPTPMLGVITVPSPVKAVGATVTATAPLTDAGALGGHLATWNWGDGTTSAGTIPAGATGSAVVSGNHTYVTAGIRIVTLTVTDPSGQAAIATFDSVIAYSATSAATGSGTIVPRGPTSVPGDTLPGVDGNIKATVAIDVKYRKAATTPGGLVTLSYPVGKFKFAASTLDWLVVPSIGEAIIGGRSTISGRTGSHPFRLVIVDGDQLNPKSADTWFLRIWSPGADVRIAVPLFQASGNVAGQIVTR